MRNENLVVRNNKSALVESIMTKIYHIIKNSINERYLAEDAENTKFPNMDKSYPYVVKNGHIDGVRLDNGRNIYFNECPSYNLKYTAYTVGRRLYYGTQFIGHPYHKEMKTLYTKLSEWGAEPKEEDYLGTITEVIYSDGLSTGFAQAVSGCRLGDEYVKMKDGVVQLNNFFVIELSYQCSKVWRRDGHRTYLNLLSGDELSKEVKEGTGRRIDQNIVAFGNRKNALTYIFDNNKD